MKKQRIESERTLRSKRWATCNEFMVQNMWILGSELGLPAPSNDAPAHQQQLYMQCSR